MSRHTHIRALLIGSDNANKRKLLTAIQPSLVDLSVAGILLATHKQRLASDQSVQCQFFDPVGIKQHSLLNNRRSLGQADAIVAVVDTSNTHSLAQAQAAIHRAADDAPHTVVVVVTTNTTSEAESKIDHFPGIQTITIDDTQQIINYIIEQVLAAKQANDRTASCSNIVLDTARDISSRRSCIY